MLKILLVTSRKKNFWDPISFGGQRRNNKLYRLCELIEITSYCWQFRSTI